MTIVWYYLASVCSLSGLYAYGREREKTGLLRRKDGGMTAITRGSLFVLAILPLVCLAGWRDLGVGTDTGTVYYPYYYTRYCLLNEPYQDTEVGFYLLMKLGHFLFGNFSGVLLTVAAFITAFSFGGLASLQRSATPLLLSALVFLAFGYFDSFNIMRQACASALVLFGLRYLKEEKPVLFLLSVVLAAFFHNSALIALAALLFYGVRKSGKFFFAALLSVIALPFLLPQAFALMRTLGIFEKYLDRYAGGTLNFSLANLSLLIYHLPACAVLLINGKKLFQQGAFERVMLLTTAFAAACFSFKLWMVWLARLSGYFTAAEGILLGRCDGYFKNKRLYRLFLLAYCFGYFTLVYGVFKNGEIVPYSFIF